jgi:hypothetical protein
VTVEKFHDDQPWDVHWVASPDRCLVFITPGYRPPVFQGNGLDMEGRRGDWVVTKTHTYHPSTDAPCQAIVVCTVEYQPVPQHEQSWVAVQNTIEPVLEPA